MELTLSKLKIQKAKSKDWNEILEIMEETGRTFYFNGTENYKKFYLVRDQNQKIISAFEIESEGEVTVLKYLGVRKNLQGKGIGKYIVNKVPELLRKEEIKRLYASTWESYKFWERTVLKEIKTSEVKDKFFLDYLSDLKKGYPDRYKNIKNYIVEISG